MATPVNSGHPSRPAIAVLGTGTMGAPIAHTLIADGFEVSVWDRSTDRGGALVDAGAEARVRPRRGRRRLQPWR